MERIAVVTGASRGLGKAVALGLADDGFPVILVARDGPALQRIEREIKLRGGAAIFIAADVTDANQIEQLKETIQRESGTPTILINAAGMFGPLALIEKSDPLLWIQTLQTNTIAPYLTCRAFLSGMITNGWGRIINLSSAASLASSGALNSAYVVSKVALNQFTRHLAVEIQGTGVTANVIHPGEVQTQMWAEIREAAQQHPAAEGYLRWAQWVEATGGDSPHKTVNLILNLIRTGNEVNGKFLWIEGGLQPPLPSW